MLADQPLRVVIIPPSAAGVGAALRASTDADVVERHDLADVADVQALIDGLSGARVVVAGSEHYSRGVFEALSSLRAIVRFGVGFDAVDVAAATDHGVAVFTTPGANAESVADMALALMLSCIRGLPQLDATVRSGAWRPPAPSRDLARSTVAIVGLGAIGRAVARRLRAFDCELLAVEPNPDRAYCRELGIEPVALPAALVRADIVTLHASLTAQTRHLLGAAELALLPSHATVVNTARGGLIDEEALVEALRQGRIAAAGLDVFEEEPPDPRATLLTLGNVIVTGHVSSYTELATRQTSEAVLRCLRDLVAGSMPAGCLNPSVCGRAGDSSLDLAGETRPR